MRAPTVSVAVGAFFHGGQNQVNDRFESSQPHIRLMRCWINLGMVRLGRSKGFPVDRMAI